MSKTVIYFRRMCSRFNFMPLSLCVYVGTGDGNVLNQDLIPIVDQEICRDWYHQHNRDITVTSNMICVGDQNGSAGACNVSKEESFGALIYPYRKESNNPPPPQKKRASIVINFVHYYKSYK